MGRNAAVIQHTQFAYSNESTRRRIINAATPKPGRFEEEWAKLKLVPMNMRGKGDLQEAPIILKNVKPELAISGKLLTGTALAPFGCEEVKIKHEEEDKSAGGLVIPKFPGGTGSEEQGPSSSGKNQNRDDKEGENHRRSEEPMQQDPDQAGKDDDKASGTLESPSAFMDANRKLSESRRETFNGFA